MTLIKQYNENDIIHNQKIKSLIEISRLNPPLNITPIVF